MLTILLRICIKNFNVIGPIYHSCLKLAIVKKNLLLNHNSITATWIGLKYNGHQDNSETHLQQNFHKNSTNIALWQLKSLMEVDFAPISSYYMEFKAKKCEFYKKLKFGIHFFT